MGSFCTGLHTALFLLLPGHGGFLVTSNSRCIIAIRENVALEDQSLLTGMPGRMEINSGKQMELANGARGKATHPDHLRNNLCIVVVMVGWGLWTFLREARARLGTCVQQGFGTRGVYFTAVTQSLVGPTSQKSEGRGPRAALQFPHAHLHIT